MPEVDAAFDHASLAVEDLDRSMAFFGAAFGYEVLFRDTQDAAIAALTGIPDLRCALAQLRHPDDGSVLELVCFDAPPGAHDAAPLGVGHGHVALRVADLDAALTAVVELGARPLGRTVAFATGRAVYVREPAGSVIELYEPHRDDGA
jgi:catechol 2,3-dioxygenase-like lactoylglutathione lyase family enzyme